MQKVSINEDTLNRAKACVKMCRYFTMGITQLIIVSVNVYLCAYPQVIF